MKNCIDTIIDFVNKHDSFVSDGIYYLRGQLKGDRLCLIRDWFDIFGRVFYLIDISNATVSDDKLNFNYVTYKGKDKVISSIEITGYDAACEINNKMFSFKNIPYLETIIKYAEWIVDEEFSGKKDGVIYCVLDLFRLGKLDFNESVENKSELFGYFDKTVKARMLHTDQFDDTLTVYRACKENNPKNAWYGLWSVTKQIPLNRIEFSQKISEKISKKVLTNVRI